MSFTFASHGEFWLALMPEAILAIAAMVILMRDAFAPDGEGDPGEGAGGRATSGRSSVEFLVTAYGIAAALIATVWLAGGSAPPDALLAVDGLRTAANVILLGGAFLVVTLARGYLGREGLREAEFYALLLMALIGMLVLVAARDLILLFVGLELMSIAVYVLTGFRREDPRSSEASLKYFLVGAFASAFLLYGIALLYGATGTTRLATAAAAIAAGVAEGDLLLTAGVGLFLIGIGFKIAAVPFHMWTPDAYEGAPTPVTAFMATGVKAAAFVALLRVLTVDLGGARDVWYGVVGWLAILTMIIPNLIALAQEDVKRMLAYSSIAHAGYLLVGVAAASALGRAASLFYLAAYTVMTVGSFAVVYHVAGKGDRRQRIEDYRGLGWRRPGLAAAMLVFLLSLAGFPPTAGFVGKL
ncbi:MAG: NADH-quinone oxidoreductase subunit N, partial [Gemmatimonadota bacterium]|nr:NADH-quinone oxidoreductase subunit N [Gemmatimonadota bacterium]